MRLKITNWNAECGLVEINMDKGDKMNLETVHIKEKLMLILIVAGEIEIQMTWLKFNVDDIAKRVTYELTIRKMQLWI